jgi:hypothetical protein
MKTTITIMAWVFVTLAGAGRAWPCSIFTAHDAQTILVGNNEDYLPELVDATLIWYKPAATGKKGYVAWGFERDHFSQGGMNEEGLFFDFLGTPKHAPKKWGGKALSLTTFEEMLQACATVDQALAFIKQYDLSKDLTTAQIMLVDKTGASAIFDGTTVTRGTGKHHVGTNFLPADTSAGGYPCWRYTAIDKMMNSGLKLTPAYFASMAEAARQGNLTLYTTICDLKAGKIHLYHAGNYKESLLIDLKSELAKGAAEYKIVDLLTPAPEEGCSIQPGSPDYPLFAAALLTLLLVVRRFRLKA